MHEDIWTGGDIAALLDHAKRVTRNPEAPLGQGAKEGIAAPEAANNDAYTIDNSASAVWWMLGIGILGYFMKLYGYQVAPKILGVIVARLLDENWQRAIISEREDLISFASYALQSPLSLALVVIITAVLLGQTPLWRKLAGSRHGDGGMGHAN